MISGIRITALMPAGVLAGACAVIITRGIVLSAFTDMDTAGAMVTGTDAEVMATVTAEAGSTATGTAMVLEDTALTKVEAPVMAVIISDQGMKVQLPIPVWPGLLSIRMLIINFLA